jgi:hypothetical protein
MMNKMFGFPTGACANAGKFVAGKLSAARATLDTSRLPIIRLIFMIPDPPLQVLVRLFCRSYRSSEVGELPRGICFPDRRTKKWNEKSKSEQRFCVQHIGFLLV